MPDPTERPPPERQAALRCIVRAATAACFFASFALMLTRVVGERIYSDEQIFVGGAGLIARGDGLIYRDFLYTHLPLHALLLAGLFRLTEHWMLAARLVDALCAAGVVTLIFDAARRALADVPTWLRLAGATAVAVIFAFNPIVAYTGGIAWNHNVAALCGLAAVLLLPVDAKASTARWVAIGALASAAATSRLTFAPMLIVFPLFVSAALARRRRPAGMPVLRGRSAIAWWMVGAIVVALPSIVVCLQAPAAAWFENVRYPGLTAQFSADLGDNPRVTLGGKLAYVVAQYGKPTAAAIIVAAFVGVSLAAWEWIRARRRASFERARATPDPNDRSAVDPGRREYALPRRAGDRSRLDARSIRLTCIVLAALIAFAAAFAATPMFRQYLYAPLPFVAAALAGSLALIRPAWRRALAIALLPVALVCLINGRRGYRAAHPLASPSTWTTTRWHADAGALAARVPGGKVLTLMPGLPLEARRAIYPELSIGRYAARSADYLTAEQRAAYRVPDLDAMRGWFATDPPAAVLVNEPPDTALEHRIAELAREAGYVPEPLGPRWTLYSPPAR